MNKSQQAQDTLTQLFQAGNLIDNYQETSQAGTLNLSVTISTGKMNGKNDERALKSFRRKLLAVAKNIGLVLGEK